MRDQTSLSVVAGMFHEWDKQLRGWLVREIEHWHSGDHLPRKIWTADFGQISELLDSIGWRIHSTDYFRLIDACRLVVNVYKHGLGNSLDDLKEKYPEYLHDPLNGMGFDFLGKDLRDHTNLKVSDDQFQAFSEAIVAFWTAVPENTWLSKIGNVPDWLEKSILKDHAIQQQTTSK
jgi:hypothetical protein